MDIDTDDDIDWKAVTARNARSVQTLIGWIFWDPGAIERYTALGLPGPLGYVPSRAAPLAPAGDDAVVAAFSTIHPDAIRVSLQAARAATTFEAVWAARDDAVRAGLHTYVGDHVEAIAAMADWLWDAVEACPPSGRVLFGACRSLPRPDDPLLSAWHAVNCLREWRGDTHMALLVEADLGPVEASLLHSAWVGYPHDWIARSRMWADAAIDAGCASLAARGLAEREPSSTDDGWRVSPAGVALRQRIEDRTDALTTTPWEAVGADRARRFAAVAEPPCEVLLQRVDDTAGPRYQPASRLHHR
ncbi:MAG: hypothetical protein MUF83_14275 [Acidimicrobiales bacterium]|jgi:hypothetical protein|nr:hypothetical protein [Acidimicrobiales bacterium]